MIRPLVFVSCLLLLTGCSSSQNAGESCFDSSECKGSAECVTTTPLGRICMKICMADDVFCEDGEVCATSDSDAELRVCLPGGETVIGAACVSDVVCVLGAVCNSTCATACNLADGTGCVLPQTCMGSGALGFCAAP